MPTLTPKLRAQDRHLLEVTVPKETRTEVNAFKAKNGLSNIGFAVDGIIRQAKAPGFFVLYLP